MLASIRVVLTICVLFSLAACAQPRRALTDGEKTIRVEYNSSPAMTLDLRSKCQAGRMVLVEDEYTARVIAFSENANTVQVLGSSTGNINTRETDIRLWNCPD